jgi:hypothetical protein
MNTLLFESQHTIIFNFAALTLVILQISLYQANVYASVNKLVTAWVTQPID